MVLIFHASCEHVFNSKSMLGQRDLSYFCELLLMHGKLVECEVLERGPSKLITTCTCTCSKAIHTEWIFGLAVGPLLGVRSFSPSFRPPWPHHESDKSPGDACGPSVDGLRLQKSLTMHGINLQKLWKAQSKPFQVPNSDLLKQWCTMTKCTGQTIRCSVPCTRTFQQIWARQPRFW